MKEGKSREGLSVQEHVDHVGCYVAKVCRSYTLGQQQMQSINQCTYANSCSMLPLILAS